MKDKVRYMRVDLKNNDQDKHAENEKQNDLVEKLLG